MVVSSASCLLLMAVIFVSRVVFINFHKMKYCLLFLLFSTVLFLKIEYEIKREQTVILFDLFTNLFTYISIICLLFVFI